MNLEDQKTLLKSLNAGDVVEAKGLFQGLMPSEPVTLIVKEAKEVA